MAAERLNAMDDRITVIANEFEEHRKRIQSIHQIVLGLGDSHTALGTTVEQIGADLTAFKSSWDRELKNAVEQVQIELDNHKAALAHIVNEARVEFDSVKKGMSSLYGSAGDAFQEIRAKMSEMQEEMEAQKNKPSILSKSKGFLPLKEMVPKPFGQKESDWRKWQDDTAGYLDNCRRDA